MAFISVNVFGATEYRQHEFSKYMTNKCFKGLASAEGNSISSIIDAGSNGLKTSNVNQARDNCFDGFDKDTTYNNHASYGYYGTVVSGESSRICDTSTVSLGGCNYRIQSTNVGNIVAGQNITYNKTGTAGFKCTSSGFIRDSNTTAICDDIVSYCSSNKIVNLNHSGTIGISNTANSPCSFNIGTIQKGESKVLNFSSDESHGTVGVICDENAELKIDDQHQYKCELYSCGENARVSWNAQNNDSANLPIVCDSTVDITTGIAVHRKYDDRFFETKEKGEAEANIEYGRASFECNKGTWSLVGTPICLKLKTTGSPIFGCSGIVTKIERNNEYVISTKYKCSKSGSVN